NMTRSCASITEKQRDGFVRLSRCDPDWNLNAPSLRADLNDVLSRQPQALGRRGTDQRCVVPGQLRYRFREFLQPCVVCKTAVKNAGIRTNHHFYSRSRLRCLTCTGKKARRGGRGPWLRFRDNAVMDGLAPPCVELVPLRICLLPVRLNGLVRRLRRVP